MPDVLNFCLRKMRESCVNFQILLIQAFSLKVNIRVLRHEISPAKKAVDLLKLKLYFISLVDQLSRW